MIRHFLSSAFGNIVRSPLTTVASILALALGLACFLAACGIAAYWQSGDSYQQKANRTFVIGQTFGEDAQDRFNASSSFTIGRYLKEDIPELEIVARVDQQSDTTVAHLSDKILVDVAFAEPDFVKALDFDFLAGSPASAFGDAGRVILTEDAARRLLGTRPAIGQSIVIGGHEATVGGVIKPIRQPSFMGAGPDAELRFDVIAPWIMGPGAESDRQDLWTGTDGLTFVVAPPALRAESIDARLRTLVERRMPSEQRKATEVSLRAIPIRELTTRRLDAALFAQSGMNVSAALSLLGLGGLILAIAGLNYVTLATAQSAMRTKEIGMRKLVGAGWLQIAMQTWLEGLALTMAAAVVALTLLALAAPVIQTLAGVDLLYFFSAGPLAFVLLALLVLLVAFVAGAYPALVLSHIRPTAALRSGRSRGGSGLVARSLIGLQFASASFLIILVTATQLQRAHLEQTSLSGLADPVIVLNDLRSTGVDSETLKARLQQQPGVEAVAMTSRAPWGAGWDQIGLARGIEAGASPPQGYAKRVDHDYFRVLDLKTLAGRVFQAGRETGPMSLLSGDASVPVPIVIDEAYARRLGFGTPQSAIDQLVYVPESVMQSSGRPAQPARIIGVTEAETTRLGASDVSGHIYVFSPQGRFPLVRIAKDKASEAVAAVTRTWDQLAPDVAIDLKYFDDLFESGFAVHARIGQLFIILSGAAFLIASIGLVGIAIHAANRRRREIAIRKTIGSGVAGIVRLLLVDFSGPVLIGNLAAWPFGYVAAETYLSAFANRIALSPSLFLLSMTITLVIAWTAVIGVVLKAASQRPADVLRRA